MSRRDLRRSNTLMKKLDLHMNLDHQTSRVNKAKSALNITSNQQSMMKHQDYNICECLC